jgi:hypothetical protein
MSCCFILTAEVIALLRYRLELNAPVGVHYTNSVMSRMKQLQQDGFPNKPLYPQSVGANRTATDTPCYILLSMVQMNPTSLQTSAGEWIRDRSNARNMRDFNQCTIFQIDKELD